MRSVLLDGKPVHPPKVFCIGRNYDEHIKELGNLDPGEIILFIKPNCAISDEIFVPPEETRFESEICFLLQHGELSGVGFGLDLTKVALQENLKQKRLPWEKSKAFHYSAVFSPFVSLKNYENLQLKLYVEELLRQEADLNEMLYAPSEVLVEVKKHFCIEEYDIIMSGTPKGVGRLTSGQRFLGQILQNGTVATECEWITKETTG